MADEAAPYNTAASRQAPARARRSIKVRMVTHWGWQYLNNLPADDRRISRDLWGANYERLVAIKQRYDLDNTFRLNHNVDPSGHLADGPGH